MAADQPRLPFATVAIGTYNRARWLRETLAFLTRQDYPDDRWELIIVDNRSTDDTRSVVESFASAPKAPRYIYEEQQGSSYARNRAIAEARGELVIFTDDDMLGDGTWLAAIVEPFLRPGNERVGAVGGEVIPHFPDGLPRWLEGQWEPFNYRTDVGPLKPTQLPATANLAFRASVLSEIGGFRTDLGRFGNRLTGSEDHDLVRRVQRAGYAIWFSPTAGLKHQIPSNRLTFKYAFRHAFDSSRSRVIERSSRPGTGILWLISRVPAYCLHVLMCAALSLLNFIVLNPGGGKRWITRGAKGAGYLTECLCVIRDRLLGRPLPQ